MNIIKSYHFDKDKLSDDWCKKVGNHIRYHAGCMNLLAGKNVKEIEEYSSGQIDMKPFIRQFKSSDRALKKAQKDSSPLGMQAMDNLNNMFIPFAMIPVKLNSAVHLIYKVPFDIEVQALDGLANEKMGKDINFLKNRDKIQAIAQDLADQLSQGEVDVGGTQNSSVEFKKVPFDLDLNDPLELKIFKQLIYKLQPEAAYENILQLFYEMKKINGVDLLTTYDTFKYGVQTTSTYSSSITEMPQVDYVHPSQVFAPRSYYNDFRDTSERYRLWVPTVSELFNMFQKEIGDDTKLQEIVDSYTKANNLQPIYYNDWGTTQVELIQVFVISVDKISYKENKAGNKRFITEEEAEKAKDSEIKTLYGQNLYSFYWLPKTNCFFKREKLGYAYRQQGQEAFVQFPLDIYKSQKKSCVEQSIGENKKAQIADIKLMHTIIKAAAAGGKYIDLKYIRKATEGLIWEGENQSEVQQRLLDLVIEDNIMIGDSEGMDGQNEGQFKPVQEITGGLRSEINGYLTVMQQAASNISRLTGLNDDLTGLNSNANTLNGARRLNITYGMNSINYAYEARLVQFRNVFSVIAWYIKSAIEKGGAAKKAIEQLIGTERTKSLDDLNSLKDHQFYLKINLGLKEHETQELAQDIAIMEQKQQITRLDRFIIDQTENLKDAQLLLAAIEHKFLKKEEARQQAQFQQAQDLQQQRNEGIAQAEQVKVKGKNDNVYVQGDVASKLMQLGNQLELTNKQLDVVTKSRLQSDRLNAGFLKQDRTHEAKKEEIREQQVAPLI